MSSFDRSYISYEKWYKKLSEKNPDMYTAKLNKNDYIFEATKAKKAGYKNLGRTLARAQRKWSYAFQRGYEAETGIKLTGKETSEEREQVFLNFVKSHSKIKNRITKKARREFEALY